MDLSTFQHLNWFEQSLLGVGVVFAIYAIYSVLSLLWRVPELVAAKKELAEAQTKYYNALTVQIEKEKTRNQS